MVQKNIVKNPKSQVEVQVAVPWTDLQIVWDATAAKLGQEVEVPGFRKGTALSYMIEAQLGSKLQDEFLKQAMPQFLIEALKGTDVVPIDYPQYSVVSFVKGQGLQYKAMVTNRPAVTVGDYKKIKAQRPALKAVTEEEIQKIVDDLFNRWKVRQPAGTPPTDTNPTQSGQAPSTGSGQGGSIDFQGGSTPTTGAVSDLPDDNFAKAMGATSLSDLKLKVRKDLEDNSKYNNELDYEEAILQEVEKVTTVELPEVLIQDELNRMLVSLQRRVADMGLLLDDYLKSQNKTLEQIKNEWRPQAEKNVRMELGLAEIARMENVTVTDQELQAEIDKIQDAKVKKQFEAQEPRLHLRHALRQTRTLNLLKNIVTS